METVDVIDIGVAIDMDIVGPSVSMTRTASASPALSPAPRTNQRIASSGCLPAP